jgi:hypothetical protein
MERIEHTQDDFVIIEAKVGSEFIQKTSELQPSDVDSSSSATEEFLEDEGEGRGRRVEEVTIDNMDGAFNLLSNYVGDNTGNSIMTDGDTTILTSGSYKCTDGTGCASIANMLWTENLIGAIKCEEDSATCTLNGENSRRGMRVEGTGAGTLLLRALSFQDGEASLGGGVDIRLGAIVTIELCVFSNCRATFFLGGGGAIAVYSSGTTVNVYGTTFNGNTADSGDGDDIYQGSSATITIHNTCPSPYSLSTPIQGKTRMTYCVDF